MPCRNKYGSSTLGIERSPYQSTVLPGLIDDQYALLILKALANLDQTALLQASKQVIASGADPFAILEALIDAFHQLTLLQIDHSFIDLDDTHQDAWIDLAEQMSAEDLQLYYQICQKIFLTHLYENPDHCYEKKHNVCLLLYLPPSLYTTP